VHGERERGRRAALRQLLEAERPAEQADARPAQLTRDVERVETGRLQGSVVLPWMARLPVVLRGARGEVPRQLTTTVAEPTLVLGDAEVQGSPFPSFY